MKKLILAFAIIFGLAMPAMAQDYVIKDRYGRIVGTLESASPKVINPFSIMTPYGERSAQQERLRQGREALKIQREYLELMRDIVNKQKGE